MTGSKLPASMLGLASKLKASADANRPTSAQFMKFAKGEWLWGSEDTLTESDAEWVINPESFVHGWVAWGNKELGNPGKLVGEVLVSITDPITLERDLPQVEGEWGKQVGFQMMCLTGVDEGVQVLFKSSSRGGLALYSSAVLMVEKKITAGDPELAPVVLLSSSSYSSKTYGKIHTPQVNYVKWLGLEELRDLAGAAEEDFEDEELGEEEVVEEVVEKKSKPAKATRGRSRGASTKGSVFDSKEQEGEDTKEDPPKETRPRRSRRRG